MKCPGWFDMELPSEEFLPFSKHCHDYGKNVFYTFSQQHLSGKHIPSLKSCSLLVQVVTEKMKSNR